MIIEIFTKLSEMLYGSVWVAVTAAFSWGILSVVLSPCHLAGIPLIVGFIQGRRNITTGRAAFLSTAFAGGVLITIALVGVFTGLAGRLLGDLGPGINLAVSLLLIAMGLHLTGIITLPLPDTGSAGTKVRGKGGSAAFIMGLLFGLALGPCTFAYMAPLLGIAFSVAAKNLLLSVTLVGAYAVGHALVLILAGTSAELVQRYLDWNENYAFSGILRIACGLLVCAAGLYMSVKAINTLA